MILVWSVCVCRAEKACFIPVQGKTSENPFQVVSVYIIQAAREKSTCFRPITLQHSLYQIQIRTFLAAILRINSYSNLIYISQNIYSSATKVPGTGKYSLMGLAQRPFQQFDWLRSRHVKSCSIHLPATVHGQNCLCSSSLMCPEY